MIFNYSIIVPYRDKYELFIQAIDSIPDRDDIQIIVVDNAITPLSPNALPHKQNAELLYASSSPLKGAGCARNEGLKHVRGRFLTFLDADDYFSESAFNSFDRYLTQDNDIVFFKTDSVNIKDGSESDRHLVINHLVSSYLSSGDENLLRYRFVNPIAKLFKTDFVLSGGFRFDEIRVSNDVWFSVMTGHSATKITASQDIVYVITSGENGTSLSTNITEDNWFIRYQVMVRVNQFLKSIGKYRYRIRLLGALKIALNEFGLKALMKFLLYAIKNRVGII